LYFPGAVLGCGHAAACYHWLNITAHIGTSLIVAALVETLSGAFAIGILAGVLFAAQPGPVETVAWVSAMSELLVTAWIVLSVWLFRRAEVTGRRVPYVVSVIAGVAALATHESGVALLPILLCATGFAPMPARAPFRMRRFLPFAAALAGYAVIAYVVDSGNYLVKEGDYQFGWHIVGNIIGALASLAVLPHRRWALASCAVFMAWALISAPPRIRFFALWTVTALLPFSLFKDGLSSRYLYLPAVGFAGMTAELIWWARTALTRWPRWGVAVWWVVMLATTARFAVFTERNSRIFATVHVAYDRYEAAVRARYPAPPRGSHLDVPPPPIIIANLDVQPFLRWIFRDPALTITIVSAASPPMNDPR
jgi:hypothetical protein